MIRRIHGERAFIAQRVFTDRGDERQRFLDALNTPQGRDEYRVLVFYGVGGQGKSALCHEFQRILKSDEVDQAGRVGWAAINFDNPRHRSIEQALLAIRLQLRDTAGLSFPAFDTAFARYFALDNPGIDMRERYPELFRGESELLNDMIGLSSDLADGIVGDLVGELARATFPGIGLLYKYGARLRPKVQQWFAKRGKNVLAGLDALQAHELLDKLPTYLGADIYDALVGPKGPAYMAADVFDGSAAWTPPRLCILVDTYEALWRDRGIKSGPVAIRVDEWMRALVSEAPGALFVCLGRDKVRWAEANADWDAVVEQHLLGALSDPDAHAFLQGIPIPESDIRDRIVASAKGLPFYLDLQVDVYEDMQNKGEMPTAMDFGGGHAEIIARFLDHLDQQDERTLKVAAHARALDEALFRHLCGRFLGGDALGDFGRLRRHSFMQADEEGRLVMHALMQEELQCRVETSEPGLFKAVHHCLFEFYDGATKPKDANLLSTPTKPATTISERDQSLREAVHHLKLASPSEVIAWVCEKLATDLANFGSNARRELLQIILENSDDTIIDEPDLRLRAALQILETYLVGPATRSAINLIRSVVQHIKPQDSTQFSILSNILPHLFIRNELTLHDELFNTLYPEPSPPDRLMEKFLGHFRANQPEAGARCLQALVAANHSPEALRKIEPIHLCWIAEYTEHKDLVLNTYKKRVEQFNEQKTIDRAFIQFSSELIDALYCAGQSHLVAIINTEFDFENHVWPILENINNDILLMESFINMFICIQQALEEMGDYIAAKRVSHKILSFDLRKQLFSELVENEEFYKTPLPVLFHTCEKYNIAGYSEWVLAEFVKDDYFGKDGRFQEIAESLTPVIQTLSSPRLEIAETVCVPWGPPERLYYHPKEIRQPIRIYIGVPDAARIEVVTSEAGRVIIFYNRSLRSKNRSLFYVIVYGDDLFFHFSTCNVQRIGLPLPQNIRDFIADGANILFIRMNEYTAEPIIGYYVDTFIVDTCDLEGTSLFEVTKSADMGRSGDNKKVDENADKDEHTKHVRGGPTSELFSDLRKEANRVRSTFLVRWDTVFEPESWCRVCGVEAVRILEEARHEKENDFLNTESLEVWSRMLPWHTGVDLVAINEMMGKESQETSYFYRYNMTLHQLSGSSTVIHEMNKMAGISLSKENVVDYLRFFNLFICGEKGPFYIICGKNDPFLSYVDAASRRWLEENCKEPRVKGREGDEGFMCEAYLFYSSAVFFARYKVERGGIVSMLEDEPVLADMNARIKFQLS